MTPAQWDGGPPSQRSPLVNIAAVLIILVLSGWILHVGRDLLVPIVAAILCVFAISGLSGVLRRVKGLDRLPSGVLDLISTALICLALIELTFLLYSNIAAMAAQSTAYQTALGNLVRMAAGVMELDGEQLLLSIQAELSGVLDLTGILRALAGSAAASVAVLIFVLLNIGFLMLERKDLDTKLDRIGMAPRSLARLRAILGDVNGRIGRYLAVQTLINIALGMVSWAIMAAFGLDFAIVFAIIIAVLNYIPYFGSFAGVAFPLAASLVDFQNPGLTLWLGVALTLVQFGIGNIVAPRVMGTSLNLSPWVILISLTFWTSIWGIAGAVFSVPIMAVAVVLLSEFRGTRPVAVMISHKGVLPPPADEAEPGSLQSG
jgi:predicted PurR-regulated permease PerM